ncbi:hypothetical protein ACP70R_037324 [Stipagrostis hirtigluma subsp. patula]
MDLLCDTLMVEEILPRLLPKSLICLGAVSRRYKALTFRPDFAARYWPRAGVFFQPLARPAEPLPRFLPGDKDPAQAHAMELVSGADLSFLPGPSAREKAYLQSIGDPGGAGAAIVVVHSAAGLLLCSRGRCRSVHYYVCNPMTRQWVALPELPCPPPEWRSGLLLVDNDGEGAPKRFQVVLFNHPMHWQYEGACFDLRLFSSDTGQWKTMQLQPPILIGDAFVPPPILGPSGTSYWIRCSVSDQAISYNFAKHSFQVISLPNCLDDGTFKRSIGERQGGGLRYAHSNWSVFEVWDLQSEGANSTWMLVHQVAVAELLEQNPEADGYLIPLGFHPTNDDVVFLGMTGAVFAYSIEHGTMNLQCTHHRYDSPHPYNMFPYVHPPFRVHIPEIKGLNPSVA